MKPETNIIGEVLGRDWAGLTRYQLVALAREALAELEARSDSLGDDISADVAIIDAPLEILQRYYD